MIRLRLTRQIETRARREEGSALLSSMLVLFLMTVLALSSMGTVMRDRQVAGSQTRSRTALYAAEAGIARAAALLRRSPPTASGGLGGLAGYGVTFPTQASPEVLGSGARAPSFHADPGHTGIEYMSAGGKCWEHDRAGAMSENIGGQNPIWRDALWDVRVKGVTTDGTEKVVQALVTSCHPYDS
jgi:hypothetical protein